MRERYGWAESIVLQQLQLRDRAIAKVLVSLVPIDALKPHEHVIESHVLELLHDIAQRRKILRPIVVDSRTLVILDGHHRVEALRRLGLRFAPAVLVDYDSDCVSVSSWRKGYPVTKEIVRKAGLSGYRLPPKTSRHRLCFEIPEVSVGIELLK